MDTLFVVSPGYLEPLRKIVDGLTIDFRGYEWFKDANEGLMKIYQTDIIGVVILAEDLEEDLSDMNYFFKLFELMDIETPIILGYNHEIEGPEVMDMIFKGIDLSKLNLYIHDTSCLITKDYIMYEIISPIIRSTYEPFKGIAKGSRRFVSYPTLYKVGDRFRLKRSLKRNIPITRNIFEINPVIDEASYLCLENYQQRFKYKIQLFNDANLRKLSDLPIYFMIRKYMIAISSNEEEEVQRLSKKIDDYINKVETIKLRVKYETLKLAAYKRGIEKIT